MITGLLKPAATLADGLDTWTRRISGTTQTLKGVAYGNNQFVVVGTAGTILTSPDGVTWTSRNSGITINLYAVAYGNNVFVAVGSYGEPNSTVILTSPDGVTWTRRVSGTAFRELYSVAYANNEFVTVGTGGTILTSPDGVTWTNHSVASLLVLSSIAYGNSEFMIVGGNGTPTSILTSVDGATWTSEQLGTSWDLSGVAGGNNEFVAVGAYNFNTGQPAILTSPDGITWTSRTLFLSSSGLHSIAYGNSEFVAVGGPDLISTLIVTSPDGVTWTRRVSGINNTLYDIVNGGSTFVAVGDAGTIIQSAGTATPQAAAITSPLTTPLPGPTVTFNWDAGIGVDAYWLYVGTTSGGSDLFNSNGWVTSRTQTVNNLPQTGQPIYVRLYSRTGATFLGYDYLYTAASPPAPAITSALFSGSKFILGGSGGVAGHTFRVLSSTNLSTSRTNWLSGLTNTFDGTGHFLVTNTVNPAEPRRFYLLQTP